MVPNRLGTREWLPRRQWAGGAGEGVRVEEMGGRELR